MTRQSVPTPDRNATHGERKNRQRTRKSLWLKDLACLAAVFLLGQRMAVLAEEVIPGTGKGIDGIPKAKIIEFPALKVDVGRGSITVDGRICLEQGLVEYVACGAGGKAHESLLILDCKPDDLYAAAQTIGLKPGKGVEFQGQRNAPEGGKVYLYVEWEQGGKVVRCRVEDLVWDVPAKRPMQRTPWVFVGSKFEKDPATGKPVFAASIEGNFVATYHDPYVLFDNPLESGGDDTVYEVNTKAVPAAKTPIKLVIAKQEAKEEGK